MNIEGLEAVPVHRSLVRPNLLSGCEREPFLLLGMMTAMLVFVGFSMTSFAVAVLLQMIGTLFLQEAAKADPLMLGIYRRHIAVHPIRTATPTIFGIDKKPKKW